MRQPCAWITCAVVAVGVHAVSACGDGTAPLPVASLEVAPLADTIRAGATIQLTATPKDVDGNPLSGRSVTWASGDESVATVDGTGLVTGENNGVATITATSEGRNGTARVTVWVGVTGSWSGIITGADPDCEFDLSITEDRSGSVAGTGRVFLPCPSGVVFDATGTNGAGGVADSISLSFVAGAASLEFSGKFDGYGTMMGAVRQAETPFATFFTRQSLYPAPPRPIAVREDARAPTVASPWRRRTPSRR